MIITDFTVLFVLWKLSCHIYFITVTFHLHKNHNLFMILMNLNHFCRNANNSRVFWNIRNH